jgi:hypothetical protein
MHAIAILTDSCDRAGPFASCNSRCSCRADLWCATEWSHGCDESSHSGRSGSVRVICCAFMVVVDRLGTLHAAFLHDGAPTCRGDDSSSRTPLEAIGRVAIPKWELGDVRDATYLTGSTIGTHTVLNLSC